MDVNLGVTVKYMTAFLASNSMSSQFELYIHKTETIIVTPTSLYLKGRAVEREGERSGKTKVPRSLITPQITAKA